MRSAIPFLMVAAVLVALPQVLSASGCYNQTTTTVTCKSAGCQQTVTVSVCDVFPAPVQCIDLCFPTPCCSSQAWNTCAGDSCRGPKAPVAVRTLTGSEVILSPSCAGEPSELAFEAAQPQ